MTLLEAEAAVAEYMLGLDVIGLGRKAADIYLRYMQRDMRPLLLRQRRWLHRSETLGEDHDAAVTALDNELVGAYGRCLESLRTLWLTEGAEA